PTCSHGPGAFESLAYHDGATGVPDFQVGVTPITKPAAESERAALRPRRRIGPRIDHPDVRFDTGVTPKPRFDLRGPSFALDANPRTAPSFGRRLKAGSGHAVQLSCRGRRRIKPPVPRVLVPRDS